MYQTLNDLVDGIYRVTAAVMVNSDNSNVSLYAGSQKTSATNNNTPSFYSVQSTVSGGTLEIGLQLGDGNAANWIGLDNVKLEYLGFDVEAAIAAANEQATAAESHLSDKAYTGYISNLQDAINAIKALNAETATKASIQTALNNLTEALNKVNASVADYANLNTNIVNAKAYSVVNPDNATDYSDAISAAETIYNDASAESTAATILSLQNFKVADYNYVTSTYTESASLGTWTEYFAEDLDGEGYKSGGDKYWNEWGNNTRTAKQTVTLPAGDYAISVIARGNVGTSGYLYYKIGENDEVKVDFLMKGNRGRGVDTDGKANFSDDATYNCNNEGFGWEYRFLTFTLTEETSVELGVSATFANSWVSIYAPKLFTTETSVKNLRLAEIATALSNIPEGKMNKGVKETLDEKVTAAEAANINNTKDELATILDELNVAIESANNSIAAYKIAAEALSVANDLKENHNLATEDNITAFTTAINNIETAYNDETLSDEEATNAAATLGTRTEWHAGGNSAAAKFMEPAWDFERGNWDDYHINTWSSEGDNDGSNFKAPFMEFWTSDDNSLGAKVLTGSLTSLENGLYSVSALIRVRAKNETAATDATGITMDVNGGTAVDVTEGTQVGESQFTLNTYVAEGLVKDGNLYVHLNVSADNNISWLSFKNVKYTKVRDLTPEEMAVIPTGITLDGTATIFKGKTLQLTPAFAPENATQFVTWASDNETVATVSAEGVVTAVAYGTANITVTSTLNAEATATCAVTVTAPLITEAENLDFAEGPVKDNMITTYEKDMASNNTTYSQMQEVSGWAFGVTNGDARAAGVMTYGSSYGMGANANTFYAPATNPSGEAVGNALGMVGVWSSSVQYIQNVKLPAGAYTITVPVYRNGGATALTKNLIGVVLDDGTEHFASTTSYKANEWTTETIKFNITEDTYGKLSLGLNAPNNGSNDCQRLWIDGINITFEPFATADEIAALNNAIEAAEAKAKSLGFDEGEFAPYKNIEALKALASAKALEVENPIAQSDVTSVTEILTNDWTANEEEVDAIFDGQFATTEALSESGKVVLPGWTKVEGIRLLVKDETVDPGLAYTDGKAAVFSWGGTTLTYGEQAGYTLPMNKYSIYELTFKVSGWRDGDMPNWISVTLDEDSKTYTKIVPGRINDAEGNPFATLTFYVTPTADNSILKIYGNKHFTIADLSMKLANAIRLTDEAEVVPETTTNEVTVLYDRELLSGWNSLVLPFEVTQEELGIDNTQEGERVLAYTGTKKNGDNYTLNFEELTGNLAANTPYLIKKSADGESMQFSGKIISPVDEPKVADAAYTFAGTYVAISKDDNKIKAGDLTVGASQLNKAKASKAMKAFRAYFRSELPTEEAQNAKITVNIDGQETDAITAVEIFKTMTEGIYNLQGQKVNKAQKGVYIVNGKKVVIK